MKKLLSLLICICLTVCTVTAPVEAQYNEIPERVSGLLNAIGVTRPEDNVDTTATISRGQFAVYAARLAGERFVGESNKYYTDIPEGSFCYNEVSTLVNLGALSVPEDKLFNPNNAVTYSEACKILICVLGFKDYAEAKGGYPAGYEYMVKQSDINMGLDGTEMNLKNAMQMIYNACHVKLLDVSSIKNSYITWVPGQETILSITRDIYCIEGRIDKSDIVSLTDESPLKDGLVEISGVSVYTGETGIEKDLGHYVDAYYLKNSDKDGTVFYYYDKTETTVIDIDDFDGYNQGVLTYADEKSDKIKTLNIGTDVPILLNGKEVRDDIPSAFNDTNYGHIEVTYYNNEIVLVHIKRAETMVVKYTSESHKMAWDEYRANKHFEFDENNMDRLKLYAVISGTEVTFSHLQKGQVLTIYRSLDGKAAEIYISEATVTGSIEEIKDDEVKIDGVFYKVNKELKDYVNEAIGIQACFYLDAAGAICVMEPIVAENIFAYIYAVAETSSPFDAGIKIKIFTLNSEHRVVDIELPVTVDGDSKKTVDDLLNTLAASGDMGTYRQLVGIKTNSKGKVVQIDTAAASETEAEEKGSLVEQIKYTGATTQFYNSAGYAAFFPAPIMFRDTKVLVVPEESYGTPAETNFKVTDKSYFNKTLGYKISSYKYDTTHKFADIVIVRQETVGVLNEADLPIMVDEVYEKLDQNGNPVKVINGLCQGNLYEEECAEDVMFYSVAKTESTFAEHTETHIASVDDLRRGDLIRTATDVDGRICLIQVLHDFEEHAKPYWFGNGAYADRPGELRTVNSKFTLTAGYVIEKWIDKNRSWDPSPADRPGIVVDIGYSDTSTIDRTMILSSDSLTVYDIDRDYLYQGRGDDIIAYLSGCGGTDIFVASQYFEAKGIYIYVYPKGR